MVFASTSSVATFDANGNYSGGCIVEHSKITYASVGLDLNTNSPYINNSTIELNDIGIRLGNYFGASPRYPLTITNSKIAKNKKWGILGGPVNPVQSGPISLKNNVVLSNGAGGPDAGGIYLYLELQETVLISRNIFLYNFGGNTGGMSGGSASIRLTLGALPEIYDNVIISSDKEAGCISTWFGGSIHNNLIQAEDGTHALYVGTNVGTAGNVYRNNTIIYDGANTAVESGSRSSPGATMNNNNIVSKSITIRASAWNSVTINAENNWWGTNNESEIQSKIHDWNDDNTIAFVDYLPFLNAPDTTAPISPPSQVVKQTAAGGVQLTWNANPEGDRAGYKIYYGNPTGYSFSNFVDVGNVTSYTLSGVSTTDTIAVTAYDMQADGTTDQVEGHESWFSIAEAAHPTVTISSTASSPTKTSPIPITVTLSESVTGFTAGDVSLTNGTITSGSFSGSGSSYSFTVTPSADGVVKVDIAANVATDAEGNGNTAASQFSITYDGTAPVVNAGSDVTTNSQVTLDGTGSTDATSGIASYAWSKVSGTGTITFGTANASTTTISSDTDGTFTIRLTVTDNAGNSNTDDLTFIWDTTGPTVSSFSPLDNATGVAIDANLIITFTENVDAKSGSISIKKTSDNTLFESVDVTSAKITGSGGATITINPAGTFAGETEYYVLIDATAFDDQVGNSFAGISATTSWSFTTADVNAPTVSISSSESSPTNVSPIPVTVTFSESVTGFSYTDVTVGNGSVSNFSGSGSIYRFDMTPTTDGVVTVDVPANAAEDAAGNGNAAATQFSVTYDATAPTTTISSTATSPTSSSPISVTVTFSESVTGFAAGDVSLTNGSISTGSFSGSGSSYSFTMTPVADGTVTVNIGTNVAADAAGNGNTAASQFGITYDTTSPAVTISSSASSPTNTSPVPITVAFSEDVTGFISSDVTITNGTVTNGSFSGSGSSYSFTVTPSAAGTMTVNVGTDVATDAAGNGNIAATQFTVTYDSTAPTVASQSPADGTMDVTTNAILVIEFSDIITVGTGNVTIKKGFDDTNFEVVDVTGSKVTVSTVVVTVDPGSNFESNTEYYVLIDATAFRDLADNEFAGISDKTTWNFTTSSVADNTPPSSTIAVVNDGTGNDVDYQNSFTMIAANWSGFTDEVGVVSYDWAIGTTSGGTGVQNWTGVGNVTSATNSSLTLTEEQTYYAVVRAKDGAGNVSDAAASDGVTIDATGPTVTISSTAGSATNTSTIPITVTFNEAVTGFEASDVTVVNATVSSSSGSGTTYVLGVAPSQEGTVTVDIGANVAQDAAGNGNATASQFSIIYDVTAPTAGTVNDGSGADTDAQASTTTVEANWSGFNDAGSGIASYEWAIGTTLGGTDVQNWTEVGNVTMASNSTLSLTDGTTCYVSVRAKDAAGNVSSVGSSDGVTVNASAPTVSISSSVSFATNTSPIPITVAFSVAVTGFEVSDVTVGSGVLIDFSGSGTTYTFDVIPSGDGIVTINIGENVAQDAASNNNTAAIQFSIIYDATHPTAGTVNDGSDADVDFQASATTIDANWVGFRDAGSEIAFYEWAISSIPGDSDVVAWTDNGTDSSATAEDLSLSEGVIYYANVKAYDMAANVSEVASSDGVQVDVTAPTGGIVNDGTSGDIEYSGSANLVSCNWGGFDDGQSGISRYEVAIGSTPGGTDVMDFTDAGSGSSFAQTGLSLEHGSTYYCSVRAIDLAGNVSDAVSSDGFTVDVYPGPPSVVEATPDSGSYLPLIGDLQITLKFSETISHYELSLLSFLEFTLQYDEFQSADSLIVIFQSPLASLDTIQVSLKNVADLSGQVSNEMTHSFPTALLADYTGDLRVDVSDLSVFVDGWKTKNFSLELGPVTGEIPHFVLEPDAKYDLRDVMVFTRMWNWSHSNTSFLARSYSNIGIDLQLRQSAQNVIVLIPEEASAGELILQYQTSSANINVLDNRTAERILISKKDEESGQVLVDFGYLTDVDKKHIVFDTKYYTRENSTITVSYVFYSDNRTMVSMGTKEIDLRPIPEEFASHQNYPNPFNPYTTILYDLTEDSRVILVIYDILGREVRTLVNDRKIAGYHSILWDGKDRTGGPVSSGVYFYHIHAEAAHGSSYSKSHKMLLLK
ncbi:MAG: Ig-like domain-containing protein [Candidatus Neomarinimicrobiota bacterium]